MIAKYFGLYHGAMAPRRIDKTSILRSAQKAGHHALNKSAAFGTFARNHPIPATLGFIASIIGIISGVLSFLPDNVQPQVSAVVGHATASIQADDDKNTKEILESLNAHFAAQSPTTAIQSPHLVPAPDPVPPKSIQPPPMSLASIPAPISPPRVKSFPYSKQAPSPWPVVGLTVADEKTLPIAIRAQEQDAPGHFLDRPTANALFKLLKSDNFDVVNETTSLVDESKIALFIDLDVTPQPLLPSPPMTCDVDKTTSIENVSVQVNLIRNDGETLYSPTPIFGTGFGCPDQTDYESTANMGAATDAAKKIYEQISSLASSK